MALSAYVATGGPDEVGAAVTATQAIANGVVSLQNNQGNQAPNNQGGWNYTAPKRRVTCRQHNLLSRGCRQQQTSSTGQTRRYRPSLTS